MKKLSLLFFIAFSFMALSVSAQLKEDRPVINEKCGFMHHLRAAQVNHPEEVPSDDEFERWMQKHLENYEEKTRGLPVITIPTVVHVIHNGDAVGSGENISDAQVLSQIEVLNNDYRRKTGTPGYNTETVGADTEIEFCMASTDPDGNPTNGINRVNLGQASYGGYDISYKAPTIWDPNQYFNIWVIRFDAGSGILGFATFPQGTGLDGLIGGTTATNDGVVIGYNYFGSSDYGSFNLSAPFDKGRTATHEVGHWLGLRHIWGDGGCTQDDFCDDTPDSDAANYNCPTTHTSCGSVDMVRNYMDYTNDACMNIFTQDQKARMVTAMMNGTRRASLMTSTVCNFTPTAPTAAFSSDLFTGCPGLEVQFVDQSTAAPTNWNWSFPGGTPNASTQQNPTVVYNSEGTYNVSLTVSNSVGSNSITQNGYVIVSNAGTSAIFVEDFEGDVADWGVINGDGETTWTIAGVGGSKNGASAAGIDNYNYNATGQRDGLVSPNIDISGNSGLQLSFHHAHKRYSGSYADSLVVYGSTDGGANWIRLWGDAENGSNNFATGGFETNAFSPANDDDWCYSGAWTNCVTLDLSAFEGASTLRLMFENVNDYGNNIFVDNVIVSGACAAVSVLPTLVEELDVSVDVAPNPFDQEINVSLYSNQSRDLELGIFDALGRNVMTADQLTVNGQMNHTLNTGDLPGGIYFLRVTDGDKVKTVKLMKF